MIVNLLEPDLCLACRFCRWTEVSGKPMIKCLRKDCDNWDRNTTPIPITREDIVMRFDQTAGEDCS